MSLTDFFPYLNIVIALCLTVGGLFAIRQGYSKTAGEIQERVIAALNTEMETIKGRVERVEEENERLNDLISTIKTALSKRGIVVTIDGDLVTIEDGRPASKTYTRTRSKKSQAGASPPVDT